VLIAEMLLLTALDDKGSVPVGSGALVQVGLTGALLADLAIDGQLAVAEDGTVRAGDTRPGDELLADVYDAVREHLQGRNVRQVIGGLSHRIGGSWNRVVDRLTGAGVLGRDRPSLLRQTRHPVRVTAETRVAPGVAKIVDELIVAITVAATTVPPFFVFLADGRDRAVVPGKASGG
jgi:hypothetical protein